MPVGFPKGYTPQAAGGSDQYLNFKTPGKYYFRVLEGPLIGFEYWQKGTGTQKDKPVRSKIMETPINPVTRPNGMPDSPKEFYAFKVFAYDDNTRKSGKVKVLSVTTATIKNAIYNYMDNPDFPTVDKYDFVLERVGTQLDTQYNLTRLDSSPLPKFAVEAEGTTFVNLEALYTGGDPFSAQELFA